MRKFTFFMVALFATMFVSASYGATLTENFEQNVFAGGSYTKRTVNATTGSWTVAGIGTMTADDHYNGTRSIRFRGNTNNDTGDNQNRVEMNFDKTGGIGTVSFKYASYSSHSGGILNLEYSIDQGTTWVLVGSTPATPTWATGGFLSASFDVDITVDARIRITKTSASGSTSVNIDDLVITDFGANQVATPVISPTGGIIIAPVQVSISCDTLGAAIYYTLDGTTPTVSSTPYSMPFTVSETTTVKAIAIKEDMDDSEIATTTYTLQVVGEEKTYSLITSTDDLEAGAKYLIVSAQDGNANAMGRRNNANNRTVAPVTIVDGNITTTPAIAELDEYVPFEITLGGTADAWTLFDELLDGYLKASSSSSNNMPTTAGSADWTISFADNAAVLTCTTGSFSRNIIRYNGTNIPPLFSCYETGQSAVYLFKEVTVPSNTVATPEISPVGGEVTEPVEVEITCATVGATIYYTLDGTTPTASSTEYTESFTVTATTTVKAIAIKEDMDDSEVATVTYTFVLPTVATPEFSPIGGNVTETSVEVEITCATEDATIYYTLDGTTPTASSTEYTEPFTLTATTTVKAIAIKEDMTDSEVASVTYTFIIDGLNKIEDNAVKMFVSNGVLNVISDGGMIEIFDVLGIKVLEVNANIGVTSIGNLPQNQLFIVKIGNKNGKVVVR